jgi:serine phosphatase RsbU (regulator of sigma subunit)
MKNITQELQERLDEVKRQKVILQKELENLVTTEAGLKSLLEHEQRRWGQMTMLPNQQMHVPKTGSTPLSKFLLDSLKRGNKSVHLLKDEALALGLLKNSKYPNRSVHFALVALKRGGLVEKTGEFWHLKETSGGV